MGSDYSDAMLRRLVDEAQRALRIRDAIGRADVISGSIQPYAGWALRWAIEDCRAAGMSWEAIAGVLHRSYPSLLRQFEAGGPVYTVRAAHSSETRNFDAETPLRRAATALAQQMVGLGMHQRDAMTWTHLHEPVDRLASAQCVTDDSTPLLRATREVLGIADRLWPTVTAQTSMTKLERDTWRILTELRVCYKRASTETEAGRQVAELKRPLMPAPSFTRMT